MGISENIKALREKNNQTLEEVAKAIGSSKQTIQRYETGEIKNIPYDKVIALAEHFIVTPGYLMGWEEKNKNPITDNIVSKDIELLDLFHKLNDSQKNHIISTMKLLIKE